MDKKPMTEVLREKTIFSNVVSKDELTIVQSRTLGILSDALASSFGPHGSNSILCRVAGANIPITNISKDGHTILKEIMFNNIIEQSTKDSIVDMTKSIVVDTGDGTTSTVLLAKILFDILAEIDDKTPYEIMGDFDTAVELVSNKIYDNGIEFTPELARDIAYISTNGNESLSNAIYSIYEKHGTNMHISIETAHGADDIVYAYDGIIYNYGYQDATFINSEENKDARLDDTEVYVFFDPINNIEMGSLLHAIIENNIIGPLRTDGTTENVIPTTIITSLIGTDYMPLINNVNAVFNKMGAPSQLLVLDAQARHETLSDMATMTGATLIRKYIDYDQYEKDVKNGDAPTVETMSNFAGYSKQVIANSNKSTFIGAKNQDTPAHDNLIKQLEALVNDNKKHQGTIVDRQSYTSRLNNITVSNVIYAVGGLSAADRDNKVDLLDDAVTSCKSASQYGVGQGSNVEGFIAVNKIINNGEVPEGLEYIFDGLLNAYRAIITTLLKTSKYTDEEIDRILEEILSTNKAYNIRTKECDGNVRTSIKSDVKILEVLSKILTKLVTANQFITPTPVDNIYMS